MKSEEAIVEQGNATVEGPFFKLKASGQEAIRVLIAAITIGSFAYLIWRHDEATLHQYEKLNEQNAELIYVLSLSVEDREKLRIVMPDSLRRKMRQNQ